MNRHRRCQLVHFMACFRREAQFHIRPESHRSLRPRLKLHPSAFLFFIIAGIKVTLRAMFILRAAATV